MRELVRGKGPDATAGLVGGGRTTLYMWMQDPKFMAEMNRWRSGAIELARGQLVASLEDAASTVAKAIRAGDVHVAMAALKGMGVLRPIEPGDEDGEVIERRRELRRRKEKVELDQLETEVAEAEVMTQVERRAAASTPSATAKEPAKGRPQDSDKSTG